MERTLYFCLNSLDKGEDINLRRMWEGAEKWRQRFLRREDDTFLFTFILILPKTKTEHTLINKLSYGIHKIFNFPVQKFTEIIVQFITSKQHLKASKFITQRALIVRQHL